MREIHRWPVNSSHKGQWRGALMFYLICDWINNREAGDLTGHLAHYDVTVRPGDNFCRPVLHGRSSTVLRCFMVSKREWLGVSWTSVETVPDIIMFRHVVFEYISMIDILSIIFGTGPVRIPENVIDSKSISLQVMISCRCYCVESMDAILRQHVEMCWAWYLIVAKHHCPWSTNLFFQ